MSAGLVAGRATARVLASGALRWPGLDRSLSNLVIHRASRLEFLARDLDAVLSETRPDDPLRVQTVVVAHAGMGRWLRQFLALDATPRRVPAVVANLALVLPFEWLDRLEGEWLEHQVSEGWQRDALRWSIDAALGRLSDDPALARTLHGEDGARQRFRLAERLTTLFAHYLLYRRGRVVQWEAGREVHWQARLWRELRRRVPGPHRGTTLTQLLAALRGDSVAVQPSEPHLLFGFNHLPPDHLELVEALAAQAPVHVFHPVPTFALWGDLATERAIVHSTDAESLHLDLGHPLIAALGGHGQVLAAQFESRSGEHGFGDALDEHEPPRDDRLGIVQRSLRELDDAVTLDRAATRDASLRVHVCHTRLRELEALRDAILARLVENPALRPRDIVVMAPDIDSYAALLPAVFGDPEFAAWLPYQCADRSLQALHPLLASIDRLLGLDSMRFDLDDLLDLLALPAVSRRFGADADTIAAIAHWARAAGVSWGIDARDRWPGEGLENSTSTRADDLHTWQFALDRATAGYLCGSADQLLDGVLPLDDVGSSGASALAVLADAMRSLRDWRDALGGQRTLAGWADAVRRLLLDGLFAPAPDDLDAADALKRCRTALAAIERGAATAGRVDAMSFAPMREALRSALDGTGAAQPFLGGGITVCGMVPARALPFPMVCVLGLNDGEFPRIDHELGLDLTQAPGEWRSGDRSQRDEDRYLFLEAILSAREALHLSYRGWSASTGDGLEPSAPLAELMSWLDAATARDGSPTQTGHRPARPWRVEHPLQPFALRAFDGSLPGVVAFDARQREAAHVLSAPPAPLPRFLDAPLSGVTGAAALNLRDVVAWLREPGRAFLRDSLELEQPWLGPSDDSGEPLDATLPRVAKKSLSAALIEAFWREGELPPALPAAWRRSGVLPAGHVADLAFDRVREVLDKVAKPLTSMGLASLIGAPLQSLDVQLGVGQNTLRGRIDEVSATDGTLRRVQWHEHQRVGDALAALLEWAVLRLDRTPQSRLLLWPPLRLADKVTLGGWVEPARVPVASLSEYVASVCARYQLARATPMLLPPKSGSAFFSAPTPDAAAAKATQAWLGAQGSAGESTYTHWSLLTRGTALLDDAGYCSEEFLDSVNWARAALAQLFGPAP